MSKTHCGDEEKCGIGDAYGDDECDCSCDRCDVPRNRRSNFMIEEDALCSLLRRPYRARRLTARPDDPTCFEDPAPPWVPAVIDALKYSFRHEPDRGLGIMTTALAWCAAGEPTMRAEQLCALVELWPGSKGDMLREFIKTAVRTGAGAAKGAKRRPVVSTRILDEWPPLTPPPQNAPTISVQGEMKKSWSGKLEETIERDASDAIATIQGVVSIFKDRTRARAETVVIQDPPPFHRASGEAVCNACLKKYREHDFAMRPEELGYDGQAFLRRLCDGSLVKL